MIPPKLHIKENERLKDLESYHILDTIPEEDYDNIIAIAAQICDTEISLISLIDEDRQWFKSRFGLEATETPRNISFCGHAINDEHNTFIVENAKLDERFFDNPLVTGPPKISFYAGVPLISDNGLPLGTLCVLDSKSKTLTNSQLKSLNALANQVMNTLNLRKNNFKLENTLKKVESKNQELERFAYVAAHDLKSPLFNISGLTRLFIDKYKSLIDTEGVEILGHIENSSNKLKTLIDGLLEYSKSENIIKEQKSEVDIAGLQSDFMSLFSNEKDLTINFISSLKTILTNKTALNQILINLVTNAIKYNDKKNIEVEIGISSSDKFYEFYVKDNGIGIAPESQEKIFNIFEVISNKDRFGRPGNGIGLATVKKMVENSGGKIDVFSEIGKGSKFIFTLEK
ncbi:MAG: GAF domain-containing sensor histidine kinase [Flavobacteriia bacterium]|nr:GAF domain-containing sensor histidine kinase [Flavobacteriia bacterium]OIP48330.1 MAG: histidine kinase [Flavobacteriaceae bacterium CG2_30_31_66]PIV96277.1 MAG: histidine kinase [Flavobacteriaceae bacterium CG17_big_fil_post_rev_8_21_14_2_50_31_13]PIX12670.1 MAG: histidine kinase [Flavobacteriaceae bacterium CG_4_8_14_3_um_filter_31_8]PIY13537.1 MAG: histidine kinase [Flavobacteriaceae bacterium CG_4_10_14_3_um_filter_31_253]PIZ09414.1 MAG: histidine kinase [Flavobacteriaceae bacterium CG